MKKLLYAILALSVMLFCGPAFGATVDSVTVTDTGLEGHPWVNGLRVIKVVFVDGDDDDAISETLIAESVTGYIQGFRYVPDGTATPAAAGDFYVKSQSSSGFDLLFGDGEDTGNAEIFQTPLTATNNQVPFIVDQDLYFSAAALDTADAAGTLYLYILNPNPR